MIIKYIVPNPYYDKEENKDLDWFAYEYIDNIDMITTYQRKNALGEIFNVVRYSTKPGCSIDIFVEDELYIMNDEGKTIRVIRPHRVIDVEGPKTKEEKASKLGDKSSTNNAFSVHHLLKALSLEGVYRGNRLLEAVSVMAEGKWDHDRIVDESTAPAVPDLYEPALVDGTIRKDDVFKLFAGHSKYNGCSVIRAIEALAYTGVIAPPLPVEEEEELRKLGKFNCIVCMDRSKCATCDK